MPEKSLSIKCRHCGETNYLRPVVGRYEIICQRCKLITEAIVYAYAHGLRARALPAGGGGREKR